MRALFTTPPENAIAKRQAREPVTDINQLARREGDRLKLQGGLSANVGHVQTNHKRNNRRPDLRQQHQPANGTTRRFLLASGHLLTCTRFSASCSQRADFTATTAAVAAATTTATTTTIIITIIITIGRL